jgi:hypothetical protein
MAEGYDDGTLNRSESVRRTIGGSIDHSVGAVYYTWRPTIMVRYEEPVSGYGNTAELETFYKLNDPTATPNMDIDFIDNHGVERVVQMVGDMQKQALGCMIEGQEAWYIYRLELMQTTAEA